MARIVVFGATGYAGGKIAAEAEGRGHDVVRVARKPGAGITAGSVHDESFVLDVAKGADAVVVAVPAAPADGKGLADAVPALAKTGARIGVVGGAGSLQVAPGGPQLVDTPGFPAFAKGEAQAHVGVLEALRALPDDVDWFYVSPAPAFGSFNPGQKLGRYRVGGDQIIGDNISGDDYALAFVDELDKPAHRRQRFSVAH
ncbi:NAD(P)-dependent oxidoreductase [Amycolatopsis albispora]|uniref:NAD-dependent epimerase n=1 Tax=Amycolatopsis albispora TaxID=1804986 RepID=A0A344LBF4_9PSEU|nr:NAD(P)H-binding protein [Amycolatopsis albispora]AXB45378.1 NAD-dependent epimerase [Amycolatopsis albispora]